MEHGLLESLFLVRKCCHLMRCVISWTCHTDLIFVGKNRFEDNMDDKFGKAWSTMVALTRRKPYINLGNLIEQHLVKF